MKAETPPEIAAYFASFAARRRQVRHECRQCGIAFDGLARAIYCSAPCRMRAFQPKRRATRGRRAAKSADPEA